MNNPSTDVTLSLTLGELQRIIVHQRSFADSLKSGETKVGGSPEELERFFGFFDGPASAPPALTTR
jgi:alkyl sulfatase BDS1-like metallo-beta-lactamase superfamily hydrolase